MLGSQAAARGVVGTTCKSPEYLCALIRDLEKLKRRSRSRSSRSIFEKY